MSLGRRLIMSNEDCHMHRQLKMECEQQSILGTLMVARKEFYFHSPEIL